MLKYLFLINIFSFFMYGIDKFLAKRNLYRISEFILLCFGGIGGVVGSILGMLFFRHKIRKNKFWVYLLLFFVVWSYILMKFYLT